MKRCLNCMDLFPEDFTVCPHCGYDSETPVERIDQLKPGSMLKERFYIGNPLGRGGFGITYIAWDTSLARKVAIKEYLPRGLAVREPGSTTVTYDTETKETFLRGVDKTIEESRKLAGFSELESVVNVYDCFKENGTAYIVMEVLKGENVKEKVRRLGKLPFDETLKIMTPVLKTLAAVHKTGIIHRDISPDNIFICDSGKVKLLDFGSARIADSADEKSRSIVLKHGYAPKEQYTAKGRQGPFTDIYSVCATIYKMLTGITPVESLERISGEDELQDIAEIVKIPSGAAKAIMQGLAVNASDRIQSADELLERLSAQDEKKSSAFYEAENTVTLYMPGVKSAVPAAPVPAKEIIPSVSDETVSISKSTPSIPEAAPRESEPAYTDSYEENRGSSGIIKKAGIAAACVALVAACIIAVPKLANRQKAETMGGKSITEEDISETASKISTTVAELISEITSTEETETSEEEATTAKEETTVDVSSLSSAYIKTKDANSKVNLRESPDTTSKSLATLSNGDEVKIIEEANGWYKVYVNGKTGYIKSDYITTSINPFDYFSKLNSSAQKNTILNAAVGDIITFGLYEQDNDASNGKEKIEWRVLAKKGNRILVISKYGLDAQPYNNDYVSVTWETCSLRKWLNSTFFNSAFSKNEQKMIPSVTLNNTTDKVFLLSTDEASIYFKDDNDRMCAPTAYAISHGAATSLLYSKDGKATTDYWLRSRGASDYQAAFVFRGGGTITLNGVNVNDSTTSVRPAIWIEAV